MEQGATPVSTEDIFPAPPEGAPADLPHRGYIRSIVAILDTWLIVDLKNLLEKIESGNKKDTEADIRKMIKAKEHVIVKRLLAIVQRPSKEWNNTTVRIAKDLLDRLYGKAAQASENMDTGDVPDTVNMIDLRVKK